jgi:hypothetical protein
VVNNVVWKFSYSRYIHCFIAYRQPIASRGRVPFGNLLGVSLEMAGLYLWIHSLLF